MIVTREINDAFDGDWFPSALATIGVMLVVSFVAIGVAPRTLGRQHNERVALWSAAPLSLRDLGAGAAAAAADPDRQRADARQGLP